MSERWRTDALHETAEDSVRLQPQYIEISDTGSVDALNTVLHQLKRTPRGVRVVNVILDSGDECAWYRLATDPDWTDRQISLRFRAANARVLLEVF